MRVVIYLRRKLVYEIFVRGSVCFFFFFFRDVVRTFVSFSFLYLLDTLFLYIGLVTT